MIEYTSIKLKAEWMKNPKGSELTINSKVAEQLISRGQAVLKVKKEKSLDKPPSNKMVDSPMKRKRA